MLLVIPQSWNAYLTKSDPYEIKVKNVHTQNVNLRNTFYLSRIQNSEENKSIKANNKQEASIQSPQTTFSVL